MKSGLKVVPLRFTTNGCNDKGLPTFVSQCCLSVKAILVLEILETDQGSLISLKCFRQGDICLYLEAHLLLIMQTIVLIRDKSALLKLSTNG